MLQGRPTKSQKRSDGHQSVLHWAVRAGRFHSRVSGLELWKQEESRWGHGVELESPLPRTEQGAPQWISLKTGGQGSLGLTRDNIYPRNIPAGLVLFHLGKRCTRPYERDHPINVGKVVFAMLECGNAEKAILYLYVHNSERGFCKIFN